MLSYILALTASLILSPVALAQGDLSFANNMTDLEGTWSSNPSVSTGGVSPVSRLAPSAMTWKDKVLMTLHLVGILCASRDEVQVPR